MGHRPPGNKALTVPSDIAGLVRWYKADSLALGDGAPVVTWTDSSLNANATGVGTPVYKAGIVNGMPVVRFDGSSRFDFAAFSALNDFTAMAYLAVQRDSVILGAHTFQAPTTWPAQARIGEVTDKLSDYDGASVLSSVMPVPETSFSLVEFVRSGSTVSWYQNGVALGSGAMRAPSDFDEIGTAGGALGQPYTFLGDLAELVIYSGALSPADRQAIEAYFVSRYTTPAVANLPGRVKVADSLVGSIKPADARSGLITASDALAGRIAVGDAAVS